MKKAVVIVWNNFTNDKRVMQISESLAKYGYDLTVLAAKYHKQLPKSEIRTYKIYRISVFSSLYTKSSTKSMIGKTNINTKPIRNKIKIRSIISSLLNWFTFNCGAFFKILLIKPDFIYCNDLITLTVGFVAGRLLKSKIFFDSHELWLYGNTFNNSTKIRQIMWKIIQKHLISKVDCVITTTDLRAKTFIDQYNLKKVNVLKNTPKYKALNKKNLFREEYNIPESSKILLYQGLISKKRGVFTIVDVIKDIPDVTLIVMGMGNETNDLIHYISENDLDSKVFVKEAVSLDKLLDYTSSADIGLQLLKNVDLNHYTTISNKIFEYIMAELAIIASDFPEIRKVVINNDVGLVVDPANETMIKNAIKMLINDPELLENCKINSRKIKKIFSWEEEEKKLFELLGWVKTK